MPTLERPLFSATARRKLVNGSDSTICIDNTLPIASVPQKASTEGTTGNTAVPRPTKPESPSPGCSSELSPRCGGQEPYPTAFGERSAAAGESSLSGADASGAAVSQARTRCAGPKGGSIRGALRELRSLQLEASAALAKPIGAAPAMEPTPAPKRAADAAAPVFRARGTQAGAGSPAITAAGEQRRAQRATLLRRMRELQAEAGSML
mmetsp:Transcript_17779/g.42651  ORF Transcript_17779/g.42651 Transcript_17779/m.42651 type:complete len:208 (-) Transcript_17779:271-894(-)